MRIIVLLLSLVFIIATCRKEEDSSPSQGEPDAAASPSPSPPTKENAKTPATTGSELTSQDSLPLMQLSVGYEHNCVLLYSSGQVKCWGLGNSGQLGQGRIANKIDQRKIGDSPDEMGDNLKTVNLGNDRKVKAVSAGYEHTCVILENSEVKCWGRGLNGRLGQNNNHLLGDDLNEMGDNLKAVDLGDGRTAKAISAGGQHTCAILDDDTVKCWGGGRFIGQGNKDEDLGDELNEMGDKLPIVDLGDGRTAKAISAGFWHTCAILDDDTAKCWGDGEHGKLGHGSDNDLGDDEDEMGDKLPVVNLGSGRTAKAISAGGNHTCALLDDDTVKCWGKGTHGRLGYENWAWLGDGEDEMGDKLPVVNLGSGRTAKAISAGWSNTCVLLDNDTVKCWGWGNEGQLGQDSKDNLGDNRGEMENLEAIDFGSGRTVRFIATGQHHSCALLDDNTIKCWGNGRSGQLGQGNTKNLGDGVNENSEETKEMGDNLPSVDLGF